MSSSDESHSAASPVSISRRDLLQGLMTTGLVCATGGWAVNPELLRAESESCAFEQGVLSLDDLSGDWMRMSTLGNNPAINNFWGALQATDNLLSVTELTFPPFSQGGHSGNLRINGEEMMRADESRWYAYQLLRRCRTTGLEVETTIRMVFENQGVLFRIKLKNLLSSAKQLAVSTELNGFIARYDSGWDWSFPRPKDQEQNDFAAALVSDGYVEKAEVLIRHAKSPARVAFAFTPTLPDKLEALGNHGRATWNVTLEPGQEQTIDFVMAVGSGESETIIVARRWALDFAKHFDQARTLWEERYAQAFVPRNSFYSGNLPVLATSDARMRRVYYMSILSRLQMMRTNLPIQPRITVTGGPQYAVTLAYFWDNTLFLMSLLDPEMMRQMLKGWLAIDRYKWYARDYLSGEGRGVWYSANNISIFAMLQGHLRVTGDYGLLDEKVGEKTVLEHMQELATGWKKLVPKGGELADYGGAENLLECDPTYMHQVASLNAANVGMMRMLAALLEWRGDSSSAAELRQDAKTLAAAVLKLYVPGEGVWNCAQPDGRLFKVRHVYDFITTTKWMADDLTPAMRSEMMAFAERELLTENWMRALSLQDPAAPDSDRPDHGPMGAYDEWPPLTLEALCTLGYHGKALDAFYCFEGVTHEGPYAQAHELMGRKWDDPVRVAGRETMVTHMAQDSVFAELILGSFFGFQPDWTGKRVLAEPCLPSGFEGRLTGLLYREKQYDLTAGAKGVTIKES